MLINPPTNSQTTMSDIQPRFLQKTLASFTVLILCAGFSTTSLAQAETADSNDSVFEEVIVTAQKRQQSIYDIPVSISAFSAEMVQKKGITDLVDVGKFVPNLNVTTFSAGHTSSANPFIRGIGLQDHLITTDPGVGVYVDGVYLGRQVGQNWSLSDIERLEVLRGPQGTLYGRNSIGGAINIITRKPGDENSGRFSIQAGSRGRLNADFYGNYAISDSFAVSGSFSMKNRDGVGRFVNLPISTEVGETEDVSGRISALWKPNDRLSFLFTADANDGEGGLNPYTTILLPNGAPVAAGLSNADVAANRFDNNTGQRDLAQTKNSADGISLTIDYEISDTLSAKLLYSDRSSDYTAGLDDDSTVTNFLAFGEIGSADQTSIELQLNGDYGSWDFVAGLYYFDEDGINDQPNFTFNAGGGSETLKQELTSKAIYANIGYNVNDRLRLAGGLRYTEDEKDANVDLIFGLINSSASEDFDELSWDLSLSYELNERLTAYGSIANGYQSVQFNPRPFCLFGFLDFTQPGNVSAPNCFDQDLENITAINFEAGIKGELFDNLQMSLAVFSTDYDDLPYQVSTTSGAGFNTVNIIVDQTSTGVEWESSWHVGGGFFLNSTLGIIDVDVDDPVAVAPLTPELTLSISPEYSMSLGSGATLSFRADYSYRDEMFGEPSPDPGRNTKIDSRDLINIDISYRSPDESWLLAFYGRNITDERYENARLNTGDYILAILGNDASEFGFRFVKDF